MLRLSALFLFIILFNNVQAQGSKKSSCYDLDEVLKVEATPLYKSHLAASKGFNVKILQNTKSVQRYIDSGKFKSVNKKSRGIRVQKLEYSRPYLTYKAKLTLERIGNRFADATKSYMTVSSITRTLEDQCRLRKVNSNASLGISSHNYGNSFDISYVRFDGVLKRNPKLEKELEKVLKYYEKLGRIHYIKESYQACFHVTVRNY